MWFGYNCLDNFFFHIFPHCELSHFYTRPHYSDRQGSGKLNFFRPQTKIQKLGPIGNSQKPKKLVPYWANTKEIFSDSVRYLGYSQILNLPSSDVNLLITHD